MNEVSCACNVGDEVWNEKMRLCLGRRTIALSGASQIVTHPSQPTFAHGTMDTQEKKKFVMVIVETKTCQHRNRNQPSSIDVGRFARRGR